MSRDRFDVLERFEPLFETPEPSFELFLRRRDRKRRTQRVVAGAVALALFAATAWFVTGAPFDRTSTPTVPGPTGAPSPEPTPSVADPQAVGFIGLPPEGAAPSTPRRGELVLAFYGGTTSGARTRMWVYADGRMIWQKEFADLPYGANLSSTGYLEQRLTSEGVELLRSEVISTGMFEQSRALRVAGIGPCLNFIEVRNVDRLVGIRYSRDCGGEGMALALPAEAEALRRLDARLGDPASWLPPTAWEDPGIRAYVPSRFAVCFSTDPASDPVGAAHVLALLPELARVVLDGKERTSLTGLVLDPPEISEPLPFDYFCSTVTTDEARILAETFDVAGYERDEEWVLSYRFGARAPGPINEVGIEFEPIFPHGDWTCSACG
jgi:hypothetical protein